MAKKPLLFIDTNIFLDFYRAGGEAGLTLLSHVESVSDSLVITDQIEMEFLNNRQSVISSALSSLKAPAVQPFMPAYLADTKNAAGIQKDFKNIKKRIEAMKGRFARILNDPNRNDPVFKGFKKVFKETPLNLKCAAPERRKQIHQAAVERYQRGFPPRKKQDHSIGDAVNWEWILDCAGREVADMLIVSRDGDFGLSMDKAYYLNDYLAQEFKERVSPKKKVQLIPSLTQALKRLAVKVTPAEEREEAIIIEQKEIQRMSPTFPRMYPPFWSDLVAWCSKRSPFLKSFLDDVTFVTHRDNTLTLHFASDKSDIVSLYDNTKNRSLLQGAMLEMGLGDGCKIEFSANLQRRPIPPIPPRLQRPTPDATELERPTETDDVPF